MRDLAWTLANTTTLFTYPLSIAKGQSPDFDVQIAGQAIGVEGNRRDSEQLREGDHRTEPGIPRPRSCLRDFM